MKIFDEDKIPEEIDGINVIQDASIAIECLGKGQTIARYEIGDSMQPILISGQFCKLVPLTENDEIKQGDCVFAMLDYSVGTHMVWMISEIDGKKIYCIATTTGKVLGWTTNIIAKAYGIPYVVKKTIKKMGTSFFSTSDISHYGYSLGEREEHPRPLQSRYDEPRLDSILDLN